MPKQKNILKIYFWTLPPNKLWHDIQHNDTQHNRLVMMNVVILNATMLSVFMEFSLCYAECRYTESRYAECYYAECWYAGGQWYSDTSPFSIPCSIPPSFWPPGLTIQDSCLDFLAHLFYSRPLGLINQASAWLNIIYTISLFIDLYGLANQAFSLASVTLLI